jgi:nucleotide-binding universal stress UspA family protein
MTMIVGYAPDERGKAALHLASMFARSSGEDLVVASVVPAPWFPGMAKIDSEYHEYLDGAADAALDRAKEYLPDDVEAQFVRHNARSAPAGLLQLAAEYDANMVVLGSSSAGLFGHVALGSVTDRLVHSSPVSIALATRGFRCKPGSKVARATAAYGGSEGADDLVLAAAKVAAGVGAAFRIASFAVWSRPSYTTTLGTGSEGPVLEEWTATMESMANEALAHVEELSELPRKVETVIGRGETWAEALDDIGWEQGDVLVVGSSGIGPVAQVFLGSRATKILRHSPVPVVVVPRGRAEELAHA